jgi:uncharacterized protein YjdB
MSMKFAPHVSRLAVGLALAVLVTGCSEKLTNPYQGNPNFSVKSAGNTARLAQVSGDDQNGPAGTTLPDQLVVKAVDRAGEPVAGIRVSFTPSAGSVSPARVTTDADGLAGTTWTLGPLAGLQTVKATAQKSGGGYQFSATATSNGTATPIIITLTPSATSLFVGGTAQLSASVSDTAGGVAFAWTSSAPEVATVTQNGLVTAVAAGLAIITASAADQSAMSEISVATAATETSLSLDFATIMRGVRPRGFGAGTYTLRAPAGGKTYYVATTGSDGNPGSSAAPLRTINRAAQFAVAGDVVIIRNGTYRESVSVRNSGMSGKPIVFQAENRGGVVLTGGQYGFRAYNAAGSIGATPQKYVTVRGLTFYQYAGNTTGKVALRTARGWVIEDCMFDDAAEKALTVSDHDVTIQRTTFQNNYIHAFEVYGGYAGGTSPTDTNYRPVENLRIIDVVLRGNHARNQVQEMGTSTSVVKVTLSRGTLIDNVESYENYGTGMWLDNKNTNYTVRNSYFHNNLGIAGTGSNENGRGLYLEKNWGVGLVEDNVFADNAGAGIVIVNSNDVSFDNNLIIRNQQSIQMLNVIGSGYDLFTLKNLSFIGTHMKGWRSTASVWARGGDFSAGPAAMGLSLEESTYDNAGNAVQLVAWPAPIYGASTITQVQTKFGWEHSGKIGTISN